MTIIAASLLFLAFFWLKFMNKSSRIEKNTEDKEKEKSKLDSEVPPFVQGFQTHQLKPMTPPSPKPHFKEQLEKPPPYHPSPTPGRHGRMIYI